MRRSYIDGEARLFILEHFRGRSLGQANYALSFFIKNMATLANESQACNVKFTSYLTVRKRTASAEKHQANAIRAKLQLMDNEPIWASPSTKCTVRLHVILVYFVIF